MEHDGMPGLAGIAAVMRWLEELIVVLSAPMLIFGMGITLVDLLTDGAATLAVPWLLFAWALSQAMGIEANISGAAFKAKLAYERGAWGALFFYTALVLSLGAVAIIAGYAYAFHQSQGVPINATLRDLGIDAASWTMARAILAFVLVVISALLRFTGKKATAASKAQKLREEIELLPLIQAKREMQLQGVQRLSAQARGKGVRASEMGVAAQVTLPNVAAINAQLPADLSHDSDASIHLATRDGEPVTGPGRTVGRTPRSKTSPRTGPRKPRGAASWEVEARIAWVNGAHTVGQIERAVKGISHTAAQYWAGVFKGEERGAESVRREA
jgi:hypothetical protein